MLFVYYDEHIDEALGTAVHEGSTASSSQFRYCKPTILHKAVRELASLEREEENYQMMSFLQLYGNHGNIKRNFPPDLTNA